MTQKLKDKHIQTSQDTSAMVQEWDDQYPGLETSELARLKSQLANDWGIGYWAIQAVYGWVADSGICREIKKT
eukprot:CAMPEP_0201571002 /NCGR_PEP_ID=MMETSP0190_2-20130828/13546_1 /ASSEMBLY_ACC=CAM_ASM_000263 /TAXON_ID=37353 /ORGANISM="Rosalina sp." /LENGTH=72 /DNA_ID=CAMNT_0047995197 /DNA_START=30 /DNA_END=248 /DNA_ORIENTATION=+